MDFVVKKGSICLWIHPRRIKTIFWKAKTTKELVTVPPEENKTTLGDLFGDLFEKLKSELEN